MLRNYPGGNWLCYRPNTSDQYCSNNLVCDISITTGTTWTEEIVWQILHNGQATTERMADRIPHFLACQLLDSMNTGDKQQDGRVVLENCTSPRLIKSHLPCHLIPKGKNEANGCKYIYVARNPKDVTVSYYHYIKGFPEDKSGLRGTFEFFASLFLQGKCEKMFFVNYRTQNTKYTKTKC